MSFQRMEATFFYFFKFILNWRVITLQCCFAVQQHASAGTAAPTPALWVLTEHRVDLPVPYSGFPLASCCTHCTEYMSVLFSQLIPPSCVMPTGLFSKSTSLFLHCKQVYQYYFLRFHICALIYDNYFSDLPHYFLSTSSLSGTVGSPSLSLHSFGIYHFP